MKVLAILLNAFICPLRIFVVGNIASGIIQLVIITTAFALVLTGIGIIFALPLAVIAWIWGLIIVIQYKPKNDTIQRFG